MDSRSSLDVASFFIASTHSAGDAAKNPLILCATRSLFTPVGEDITGRPEAMYCRTFSPHFPLVKALSGSGAIPMWDDEISSASVSAFQGIATMSNMGDWIAKSAIIFNLRLGVCNADFSKIGIMVSKCFRVELLPIQTKSMESVGFGIDTAYFDSAIDVGRMVTLSQYSSALAAR